METSLKDQQGCLETLDGCGKASFQVGCGLTVFFLIIIFLLIAIGLL